MTSSDVTFQVISDMTSRDKQDVSRFKISSDVTFKVISDTTSRDKQDVLRFKISMTNHLDKSFPENFRYDLKGHFRYDLK